MSWWGRLLGREARSATSHSFINATGMFGPDDPAVVSPIAAENLATVLACVSVVSSSLASLPVYVYRGTSKGGRAEAPDHPVAALLRRPNARLAWCDLAEWWTAQTLLHGNGVLELVRGGAGQVVALEPVPWPSVAVMRLASGRLRYDFNRDGQKRELMEDDALHLRDRTDDGIVGRSRLSRAGQTVQNAVELQEWTKHLWRNHGTPSGAVKAAGNMTKDTIDALRAQLAEAWTGSRNAGKILILPNGLTFDAISVSPEDAEVLASRRFTVEELARVFSVPPPLIGDLSHGTFTNSREAARWFAQFTLAPWARKIEAAMGTALFGSDETDMSIEVDLSGLLRGDAEARWQSHKIAVDAGILDPDEIREIEGWGPRKARPAPEVG